MEEPEVAVALRYDPDGTDLPRVTAKGQGAIAAQILALAKAHAIPIHRDETLAGLLARLEIESPIPVAAFAAVAEILARLYREDRRRARGGNA